MEACSSPSPPPSPPPVFLPSAEKVIEFLVSAVIYGVFTFIFGVVGLSMGVMVGAPVGLRTKHGFFRGAAVGAFCGAIISHEMVTAAIAFWNSEDAGLECLLRLIKVVGSLLDGRFIQGKLDQSRLSPVLHHAAAAAAAADDAITTNNHGIEEVEIKGGEIFDSSGERIICSVCLQDFEVGEAAARLSVCQHVFHTGCIGEWLIRKSCCPLCRTALRL